MLALPECDKNLVYRNVFNCRVGSWHDSRCRLVVNVRRVEPIGPILRTNPSRANYIRSRRKEMSASLEHHA